MKTGKAGSVGLGNKYRTVFEIKPRTLFSRHSKLKQLNMKRILLAGALAVCLNAVHAQNFGVQAGATFYSYKGETEGLGISEKSDTKVGFLPWVLPVLCRWELMSVLCLH